MVGNFTYTFYTNESRIEQVR